MAVPFKASGDARVVFVGETEECVKEMKSVHPHMNRACVKYIYKSYVTGVNLLHELALYGCTMVARRKKCFFSLRLRLLRL